MNNHFILSTFINHESYFQKHLSFPYRPQDDNTAFFFEILCLSPDTGRQLWGLHPAASVMIADTWLG